MLCLVGSVSAGVFPSCPADAAGSTSDCPGTAVDRNAYAKEVSESGRACCHFNASDALMLTRCYWLLAAGRQAVLL